MVLITIILKSIMLFLKISLIIISARKKSFSSASLYVVELRMFIVYLCFPSVFSNVSQRALIFTKSINFIIIKINDLKRNNK